MSPQGEDFSLEPPLPWMADAICHSVDPELWFAGKGEKDRTRQAKWVCRQCPPVQDCRQYALDRPELDGVWGGLTYRDRQAARRKGTTA